MNRFVAGKAVFGAILAVLLASGAQAADTTRYVCIGNSITYGYGLAKVTQAYPYLLQKMLRSTYLTSSIPLVTDTVFDYGVNSCTLLREGDKPYWTQPDFLATFSIRPSLISVMLGANDTKDSNWVYGANFPTEYGQMLDTLSHITTKPKLFACFPPAEFANTFTPPLRDSILSNYIIPDIRAQAQQRNIPIIDVHTPMLSKSASYIDGIHPDSNGQKMLADIFYESIINSHYVTNQAFQIKFLYYGAAPNVTTPTGTAADTTGKPMLYVYPAPDSIKTGVGVLVCPGGSYTHCSVVLEGSDVAAWLNSLGITAFVLRYRYNPYLYPVPFNDGKRAMRLVRFLAPTYGLDTTRIGIMGFSAGGHIASYVATHYDNGNAASLDSVEKKKCRADFNVFAYPVITMVGSYCNTACRTELFGTSPAPSTLLLDSCSNQMWVTSQTAKTFIDHGGADSTVPIQNSEMFDSALKANGVTQKFFIDPGMPHGYGTGGEWTDTCRTWLIAQGIIPGTVGTKTVSLQASATGVSRVAVSVERGGLRFVSRVAGLSECSVYRPDGKQCAAFRLEGRSTLIWHPATSGVFLVKINGGNGANLLKIEFQR
jgi:acetyl esterase/lipase/lysophospholipase L1-like esterase